MLQFLGQGIFCCHLADLTPEKGNGLGAVLNLGLNRIITTSDARL